MLNTKTFALAGKATFTVTSKRTGTRFTFKVTKPSPDSPHFVKVLTGADNENSYTFLGTIFNESVFRHGGKSKISPDAPSAQAFAWLWSHINQDLHRAVEVHHEGKCCRCGRKLTTPESVTNGFGPECAHYMGI